MTEIHQKNLKWLKYTKLSIKSYFMIILPTYPRRLPISSLQCVSLATTQTFVANKILSAVTIVVANWKIVWRRNSRRKKVTSCRKWIPAISRSWKVLPPSYLRQHIATTVCVVAIVILFWGFSDDYEMSPRMSTY